MKIENSDISIFPKGYRKSKKHTTSERANKHLQELVKTIKKLRTHTLVIIFSEDQEMIVIFTPNKDDANIVGVSRKQLKMV